MTYKIIISGFGGQGVLFAGKVLAYAGMICGKEVSWLPSYGPEMRGGTANCSVIISDDVIDSPVIGEADALIAMNRPSLDKFEPHIKQKGLSVIDSAMVGGDMQRSDIERLYVNALWIADNAGTKGLANVVMLGKFLNRTNIVSLDVMKEALKANISSAKTELLDLNIKMLIKGVDA